MPKGAYPTDKTVLLRGECSQDNYWARDLCRKVKFTLRPSGKPCHKLPEQMETKALQVPLRTMHLHKYLKSYLVYIVLRKISLILHCILNF